MAKIVEVQEVSLSLLRPYEKNAKIHGDYQVRKLKDSIKEFGFVNPCLIDREYNIIAGHGRVVAAHEIGMEAVPCVFVEGLTDAQRRAYIIADNRLTEMGEWDMDLVQTELVALNLEDFDIQVTGFDLSETDGEWFNNRVRFDDSRQEGNDEYNSFLDKFEHKKTTDDCYTPDLVYDAVADYVTRTYGRERGHYVRPFYPGGDYEHAEYPDGCTVVDNPPFSILAEIIRFYSEREIPFFLFAPTLTLFSSSSAQCTALPCGASVTYENGASVNTSFLTNLEDRSIRLKTCPELYQAIKEADEKTRAEMKAERPAYLYPDYVITSAIAAKYSKYGVAFSVTKAESALIDALDMQKEEGKAIYGKGYLLAERAAAERAAAERAAAERAAARQWKLSDREKEIVRGMQ